MVTLPLSLQADWLPASSTAAQGVEAANSLTKHSKVTKQRPGPKHRAKLKKKAELEERERRENIEAREAEAESEVKAAKEAAQHAGTSLQAAAAGQRNSPKLYSLFPPAQPREQGPLLSMPGLPPSTHANPPPLSFPHNLFDPAAVYGVPGSHSAVLHSQPTTVLPQAGLPGQGFGMVGLPSLSQAPRSNTQARGWRGDPLTHPHSSTSMPHSSTKVDLGRINIMRVR